jgi:hypothetical protein
MGRAFFVFVTPSNAPASINPDAADIARYVINAKLNDSFVARDC